MHVFSLLFVGIGVFGQTSNVTLSNNKISLRLKMLKEIYKRKLMYVYMYVYYVRDIIYHSPIMSLRE